MTEPIRITNLHQIIEATTGDLRDIIAAMLNVVEAARTVLAECAIIDDTGNASAIRLSDSLDAFDFGDHA